MDGTVLNTFPSTKSEALAMLYVEQQDNLSTLTPEQFFDMYQDAYDRIRAREKKKHDERKSNKTNL